jgi:hypothetical protein
MYPAPLPRSDDRITNIIATSATIVGVGHRKMWRYATSALGRFAGFFLFVACCGSSLCSSPPKFFFFSFISVFIFNRNGGALRNIFIFPV